MPSPTSDKGRRAEELAAAFLERERGYRIIERNYRCPAGEIDLLALDGATLCFVEVRSVQSTDFGDPLETITRPKQRRLIRAARSYLAAMGNHGAAELRFDAVGVVLDPPRIRLVRGAFETHDAWW